MNALETYYNEHATQARQHEDQRERMTNIILAVAGALTGLITFGEMSPWTLPASIMLVALGIFGFLFAGKHYERFKYHISIMNEIRDEMDALVANPNATARFLKDLRSAGETEHYASFSWPRFRGTRSAPQATAKSWIARQRLHPFWEAVHILVVLLGVSLSVAIIIKYRNQSEKEPIRIRIVDQKKVAV